jgi:hypothetical protein
MAKLNREEIRDLARQFVKENPGGIRYSDLLSRIHEQHPETPPNSIAGAAWDLASRFPTEVAKPSRGLFIPANAHDGEIQSQHTEDSKVVSRVREEEIYAPFADWLKNELDEATVAVPIGGSGFREKWGTPDVVGVYKPLASHRIKFDLEIIAAEIKSDPQAPVVAFGQAAAYRLFAAKSYIVMSSELSERDYARLEALCMLFGIGLVLFDPNPTDPGFTIRVRAQRFSPDMFFVNEFADRLHQVDPSIFNKLFG